MSYMLECCTTNLLQLGPVVFILLSLQITEVVSLINNADQRPRIILENGNMYLVAGRGRSINFQTLDGGKVYLNDEDLIPLIQSVRQAVNLIESLRGGLLTTLEQNVLRLTDSNRDLGLRLSAIEHQNNTSIVSPRNRNLATRVKDLTIKFNKLFTQVTQLKNLLRNNECASNPCRNGGTCEDAYDGFICRCPSNWEGVLCDADVNECARFAGTDLGCQNSATCVNKPGTYECLCSSGWFGIHCTMQTNACSASSSRNLCGHGVCVSQPGAPNGYTCICDEGWTKDSVTLTCTLDVDECASNQPTCSRNPLVACVNVPGSFYCGGCPQGYSGNGYYCSDIDECQVNNGGCSMNPTVQCINTQGSRICGTCPPGYQGNGVVCTFIGLCSRNNGGCHLHAQCSEIQGTVQCICYAGYTGSGVGPNGCSPISGTQLHLCDSNPCIHGICHVVGNSYYCSCNPGYTGSSCSIVVNPCTINPCQNGGTCVPVGTSYHCRCTSEATGSHCEEQQMTCGGVLSSEEGTLTFPHSGSGLNYFSNISCAWVIVTNTSKVINVTFVNFHLEDSPNCVYDWLQIHDGRSPGDQLINRFCGTSLPNNGTIISTQHALYLWFRSDHSVNNEGFQLRWNSIDPVCGGQIQVSSHGTVTSPGYPGRYPRNRDCVWSLTADLARTIQFTFGSMIVGNSVNCSDFVKVVDTSMSRTRVLGMFCNSSLPAPISTIGPEAKIIFHSGRQSSGGTFQISYYSKPGTSRCGGTLTGSSGVIVFPSDGTSYENNLFCEWLIEVPEGERIKLTFNSFNIEYSPGCVFDQLEIHEGRSRTADLVQRLCGNQAPRPYISLGNALVIVFESDWSRGGDGFHIVFEEVCGGVFSDPSGIIMSPNYPDNYPGSKDCIYEIAQPLGKSITLDFYDFNLEWQPNCRDDYLEIRDGHDSSSPLVGKYCGSAPPTVVSTFNFIWMKFHSDMFVNRKGFYANYTIEDISCGGILKGQSGIVESPHYPSLYGNQQLCRWVLVADPGNVIQLRWIDFELEFSYNCMFDYVELYDNHTVGNGTFIGRYCGTQYPPDATSTNNILTILFTSDYSSTYSGFQVNYTQLDFSQSCGGNYVTHFGVLRSPGYPNFYPHNRNCVWTIVVPSGQQLKLNVTDFKLEKHGSCRWDFLEIRNGGSATSPLIGRYCGTEIPTLITSVSNRLYLHFKSDISWSEKGFEIYWDGTSLGCGGTLTAPSGSIMSPNYPQPYERHTQCFWKISANQGNIIQAVFVHIDIESSSNCKFDYIAFYDGADSSARLLGHYCGSTATDVIRSTSNHLYLKFESDFSSQGAGFQINYVTVCDVDTRGSQGAIESVNFPYMYPEHMSCKWNIFAPKGNRVNVTFSHFSLERPPCTYDYVQVKERFNEEGTYSPLTDKMCGATLPSPIHSSMNQVQVTMVSDYSVSHEGFRLEWVVDGCVEQFTREEGEFTSPGYPNNYQDSVECEWRIIVPLSKSVQLTIEDLHMEYTSNCHFDSLIIYGGPDITSPKLHDPICHTLSTPLVTTSSGNNMLVRFVTDSSFSGRGFKASFKSVNSFCGGLFNAPSGRIHSRNYPNNYDHNDDCMWLIRVAVNHVVHFTFMDFELEFQRNCSFDYVRIFDGDSTESPILATVCGNSLPNITSYTSTGNTMLIRMKADGSSSLKGFLANYTTACGARIVTEDYGQIDLSHEINVNRNNFNCSWIIKGSQPEDRVTLTITHMDISPSFENDGTECQFAYVEVRDGEDENAPLRGSYCGSKAPLPITSLGSSLFMHLVSHYSGHYGHFSAAYSVISSVCGGVLTSEHGAFASPGYPDSYPLNAECVWIISTSPGNRVTITFNSFELEESDSCNKDYLEVRENDGAGRLIGVYCSGIPTNITAEQILWIKFHSDGDVTAAGFVADYSLLHGNELSGPYGQITSPLYPRPYIQEGYYTWRIAVDVGNAITITFTDFYIDRLGNCRLYLAVYDGYDENGIELFKGCGSLLPDPVTSTSNMVYIVMETNTMLHGSYFSLNWSQIHQQSLLPSRVLPSHTPGCGGLISLTDSAVNSNSSYYEIQSPGYPHGYFKNLDCEWIVQTPSTHHVKLIFDALDLEVSWRCLYDYVSIYEGVNGAEDWKLVKSVCNNTVVTEPPIEGTNLMKILFHSDFTFNRTGFSLKAYAACGGTLRAPNGVIEVHNATDNFPEYQPYRIKCQWNVSVRAGRTIAVTFERLNMHPERGSVCTREYIMLRNGHSEESPFLGIGKYCDTPLPTIPETSGNHLYIKYYGYTGHQGFKLRFEEVPVSCGGEFQLTHSNNWINISSPRYPNIPTPHSECTWIIRAPGGERIQVDFDEVFSFRNSYKGCNQEYVELRDGSTENANLIGQFCSSAPNTQTTTGNVLMVHYFTDIPEPNTGFRAKIYLAKCGGIVRGYDGEVFSPGYPRSYTQNMECIWRIVTFRNRFLEIEFQALNLPAPFRNCTDVDHITISEVFHINHTERLVTTVCGSLPSPSITLSSNEAIIKFKTNAQVISAQYTGFLLHFSSIYNNCGDDLNFPEGRFGTPSYPNGMPQYRYCEWSITVPRGRRVTVNLIDVDFDFSRGTSNLGFFNNDYPNMILSLRSNQTVRQIESTGNKMLIYYYTESGINHRSFQATYHSNNPAVCGGMLGEDGGIIKMESTSINVTSFYCEWIREIEPNHTFSLTIFNATVGKSSFYHCSYKPTKLMVSYGDDPYGQSLAELCISITSPLVILSPFPSTVFKACQVMYDNHFIDYGGPLNFVAQYQTYPCGGILSGPETNISSPNYPNNYPSKIQCAWAVEYPPEKTIKVHFTELNLGGSCDQDFIVIHNGPNSRSPQIGRYCNSIIPPDILSQRNELWVEFHSNSAVQGRGFNIRLTAVSNGCGGVLHSNRDVISSPNFPEAYQNNTECEWDIRVENGFTITLRFLNRFFIESSPGCSKDFVQVFDYIGDDFVSLGKFCGRETPPQLNSTSSRMKVLFRSDDTISTDGFQASWATKCGGIINGTLSGQIFSPGYPKEYDNYLDCNYTVIIPDLLIDAHFEEFGLEQGARGCQFDNVTVHISSSYSYAHSTLGPYCGGNIPSSFRSFDSFTLIFKTDLWGSGKGFLLRFKALTCGGNVTVPQTLTSPDMVYQSIYTDFNCTWVITAPQNSVIVLRFSKFTMSGYSSCFGDNKLSVYEGSQITTDNRLGTFCGNLTSALPVLHSTTNHMVVEYVTHTYIRHSFFQADIKFSYGKNVGCGGILNATSTVQRIQAPNVGRDNLYEAEIDCHWIVRAPNNEVIHLQIDDFHIDACVNTSINSTDYCACSFLEIRDGPSQYSNLIGKYCGALPLNPIISSINIVWIRYVLDTPRAGNTFVVQVSSDYSQCGNPLLNVTAVPGILTSPSYPGNYPAHIRCRWLLEPSSSYDNIEIHLEDIDIGGGGQDCRDASLTITDDLTVRYVSEGLGQNFIQAGNSLRRMNFQYSSIMPVASSIYCGQVSSHNFYSNGRVHVSLVTNAAGGRGFKLQYSLTGCHRNYTGVQGRIRMTHISEDCVILIQTTENRTISLYFIEGGFPISENCNDMGIEVYDGPSSNSHSLSRMCGFGEYTPIFSSGPVLRIHLWSTLHYNYMNSLDITYTTTDQGSGCGGILYNYGGIFTSPMYPSTTHVAGVCQWNITVPVGAVVALHFQVFQLGTTAFCGTEFVELLEVDPVSMAETLGTTYCAGDNPSLYISSNNMLHVRYTSSDHGSGSGWVAKFIGRPPSVQFYEESPNDYYFH